MSKHTPGQWRVGGKGEYLNQLNIEPCVGVAYGHDIELIANARLIAAAPELLEALEELLYARTDKSEAMAIAAIVKAKGEVK